MKAATGVLAAAAILVLYPYLVYPAILWLWGRLRRPPVRPGEPVEWPMISISVPAFNEERSIASTLDRLLEADYPADRRQIVVISDASTDRTDEIVRQYASREVELLRLDARRGKTACENAARPHLRGSIVVNTDASVRVDRNALKPLVAAVSDPTVGIASSTDVSVPRADQDVNIGEGGYVGYEMWVRQLETRLGGIVGASGSLYAIRAELHATLVPEALSRDFAATLIAREHGLRAVSVAKAICYVPRAASLRREYRRKLRTMTRGLETLWYKRHLMNPRKYGRFSWMLASHKLARWLVPWAFLLGLASLAVLAVSQTWARLALTLAATVLGLGAAAWLVPEGWRLPRILSVPAYFVCGLVAGLVAWIRALSGELNPVWEPTKRE